MRNLHQILLQEYRLEAQCLFRDWERLWLRASDYKNHRIFTLRCLHKELIPVSIKLKSTLKTEKARKIIRKTEKDLLQARIKAINSILDNIAKQTEECKSQLPSIISAQRLRECQGFVDKVDEIRFTKVKQRQLNKYNILLNKKEGNITRANATTNPYNLAFQAGRQVLSFPLGKEAIYLRQAGTLLPPREGNNSLQADSQAGALLPPREGNNSLQAGSQAGALLPPREGSSSSQATAHLPLREGSSISQAIAHLPLGEGSNSPLATAHLPPREGSSSSQATVHLPSGEAGSSSQATAHLPLREGSSISQAIAHLPLREGSSISQAGALLPPREGSSISQAIAHIPTGEGSNFPLATAHLPPREGSSSS